MESVFLLLFWFGILHAFGPDHLAAIANFSLGKQMKKAFLLTMTFAIGHGVVLFIFAHLLSVSMIPQGLLDSADTLASGLILSMGLYLLVKLYKGDILLVKHWHEDSEHIHISFNKDHEHRATFSVTGLALSMGTLMGIGGVRGLLISLSVVSHREVTPWMILAFIGGVMLVFLAFGFILWQLNRKLIHSQKSLERGVGLIGFTTVGIALAMLSN